MTNPLSHLFRQAREGEFALLSAEAKALTADQFAAKHGVCVVSGVQDRVTVDWCDYYWSHRTGKFDGWGRSL
jgi:hypothetical protein